jgi:deuterolysin
MSCTDDYNACEGGVVAYTVRKTTNIHFCDVFFEQLPTDDLCFGETTVEKRNVRGGTTLHEFTHAFKYTTDHNYGCEMDKELEPLDQVTNADNYNVSSCC